MKRLLLIEDSDDDALLLREALFRDPRVRVELKRVNTLAEGKIIAPMFHPEVILLDRNLSDLKPEGVPAAIRELDRFAPVMILTVDNTREGFIAATDAGAKDYINKNELADSKLIWLKIERVIFHHDNPALADNTFDRRIEIAEIRKMLEANNGQNEVIIDQVGEVQGQVGEVKTLAEKTNGRVGKLEEWQLKEISRQAEEAQKLQDQAAYGRGVRDAEENQHKLNERAHQLTMQRRKTIIDVVTIGGGGAAIATAICGAIAWIVTHIH